VAIVKGFLVLGCTGHEEARVVASGVADRSDPVRDVGEPIGGELQPLPLAQVLEGAFGARIQPIPVRGEALPQGPIAQLEQGAVLAEGQQETGLFEALAKGRDPVAEPTGREVQDAVRVSGPWRAAERRRPSAVVGRVDLSSREDVQTPEVAEGTALHHEDLDAAVGVPDQHHGGGGLGYDLRSPGGRHLGSWTR
jgi:hypothetical protein